jgi:hypothetical protein
MSIRKQLRRPLPENLPATEPISLYTSVGRMVMTWTYVEASLDAIVALLFQKFGGKEIEQEVPRSLKKKVTFIKRCLKLPALLPFGEEGASLMREVSALADTRHLIAHGTFMTWPHEFGETRLKLKMFQYQAKFHKVEDKDTTLKELDDASLKAISLAVILIDWCRDIMESGSANSEKK